MLAVVLLSKDLIYIFFFFGVRERDWTSLWDDQFWYVTDNTDWTKIVHQKFGRKKKKINCSIVFPF